MRRAFLALVAALFCACIWAEPAKSEARRNLEDFDAFWRVIDSGYAYFDGSHAAWKRARDTWRPKAAKATSRAELVAALEGAIAHLREVLGDETYETLVSAGESMTSAAMATYAFEQIELARASLLHVGDS